MSDDLKHQLLVAKLNRAAAERNEAMQTCDEASEIGWWIMAGFALIAACVLAWGAGVVYGCPA